MSPNESDLFEHINKGNLDAVRQLLSKSDVNVDCIDEHGMSPIQSAAFKGNKELCELLLAHGADVNLSEHEHKYTTLMFSAISGEVEVTRLLLEAGCSTSAINSVNRTAAQMAAFVGQHACASLINNFFSREKLDYYTKIQGLETEPRLPKSLVPPLHKMILGANLHPVKIVLDLKKTPELLEEGVKVVRVLEMVCEKEWKGQDMNEVLAMKVHYMSCVVRQAYQWHSQKPEQINGFIKSMLRNNKAGVQPEMESFVRQAIRNFPYHEAQLLQQLVRNIAPLDPKEGMSALAMFTQGINGSYGFPAENACATCNEANSQKKCSACKMVNYCDPMCQKLHWFVHKKECKQLAELYKLQQLEQEKAKLQKEKEESALTPEQEEESPKISKEEEANSETPRHKEEDTETPKQEGKDTDSKKETRDQEPLEPQTEKQLGDKGETGLENELEKDMKISENGEKGDFMTVEDIE